MTKEPHLRKRGEAPYLHSREDRYRSCRLPTQESTAPYIDAVVAPQRTAHRSEALPSKLHRQRTRPPHERPTRRPRSAPPRTRDEPLQAVLRPDRLGREDDRDQGQRRFSSAVEGRRPSPLQVPRRGSAHADHPNRALPGLRRDVRPRTRLIGRPDRLPRRPTAQRAGDLPTRTRSPGRHGHRDELVET